LNPPPRENTTSQTDLFGFKVETSINPFKTNPNPPQPKIEPKKELNSNMERAQDLFIQTLLGKPNSGDFLETSIIEHEDESEQLKNRIKKLEAEYSELQEVLKGLEKRNVELKDLLR